jgi:hypothetical protein
MLCAQFGVAKADIKRHREALRDTARIEAVRQYAARLYV